MWYLYIDESGDLGFDFERKNPSRFFTLCIMVINHRDEYKKIARAVKKTLHKKLNYPKKAIHPELKGSKDSIRIKRYFWHQIKELNFTLYAITLDKRKTYEHLKSPKERIYNFISRQVIDRIPFEQASTRIQIIVDKSKGKEGIREFNEYIFRQLEGRVNPKIPINIDHLSSHHDAILQAVDLFAWGIFRKYERSDTEWYDIFREKVHYDERYI